MLVDATSADLRYVAAEGGVPGNWLAASLERAGVDVEALDQASSATYKLPRDLRYWADVWSAGQGVDLIDDIPTVAELTKRLRREYVAACELPDMSDAARMRNDDIAADYAMQPDEGSMEFAEPIGHSSMHVRAIDYPFTRQQEQLREQVRSFAQREFAPDVEHLDTNEEFSREIHEALVRSGLFRHFVPESFGGAGLSAMNICIIREELARVCPAADELFASQGIAVQSVVLCGTEEQKKSCLAGLLSGEFVFAFCLTEPAAGSDVAGLTTTAREDGDIFRINGSKRYVYAANAATHLLIFAKTDPEQGKRGITAFLSEQPGSGVRFENFPLLRPGPQTEVIFEDCPVSAACMVGERGAGIRVALGNLDLLRPSVGAAAIGMAESALEVALAYTSQRRAFGGVLYDLQAVSFRLAQAAAELDAARLLVYSAAANADGRQRELSAASAKAKFVATEVAFRVIDATVQVCGGAGLRRDCVTERMYKAIRATRIYEGSSEVMQLVISRSLVPQRRDGGSG
jgi:alkylation response protein AidB-like acyl-CoA dehydrogenase